MSFLDRKSIDNFKPLLANYLTNIYGVNISKPFTCLNPNHEDNHPSMSYSPKYNICKCFACGTCYDIYDLVGMDFGLEHFSDKYNKIAELFMKTDKSIPIERTTYNEEYIKKDFSKYFKYCFRNIKCSNYLIERGISENLINKYKIGYDKERKLIVFPLNRYSYFARSTISDSKYKTKGTSYIFNEKLINNENKLIYVIESIIDSLSLETIDPNVKTIALNGLTNYKRLLDVVNENKYKGYFVLAFDNDKYGIMYQDIVKEELSKLDVSSFLITLISNIDGGNCKDLNEALVNKRDTLKNNYHYFNKCFENIINKNLESESELSL